MSGMEMMFGALLNKMGITPEVVQTKIAEIQGLVLSFKQQQDRIEAQNAEILALLKSIAPNNGAHLRIENHGTQSDEPEETRN